MATNEVSNQHSERNVSSVTVMHETQVLARQLERREMSKGVKLPDARRRIAERIGAAPGTLRSLALGRLKKIDAALRERIQAVLCREIEKEIARLQHELDTYSRCGANLDGASVFEIEAHLATARKMMEGMK